jgi:hypothetical protein
MNIPLVIRCSIVLHFSYAFRSAISAREPITMSRTFRTLALSAALLAATCGSAFADMPGGSSPPPKGSVTTSTTLTVFLEFLGLA